MTMDSVDLAYLSACFATCIMTIADCVPFWFALRWSEGNIFWQGLVYRTECLNNHCTMRVQFLTSDSIPLDGRDWRVCLSLIPVLGLFGYTLCFCAVLVLQLLLCRWCVERKKAQKYMVLVTSLLIFSGIFCTLTVILATYASTEFYSDNSIDHAQLFPWSLALLVVADVLIIIASVSSARVTNNWHQYRKQFGRRRSKKTDRISKTELFYVIDPVKEIKMEQIWDCYDNISCADSGVSTINSTSEIPDSASAYFDFQRVANVDQIREGWVPGALPRYTCEVPQY